MSKQQGKGKVTLMDIFEKTFFPLDGDNHSCLVRRGSDSKLE